MSDITPGPWFATESGDAKWCVTDGSGIICFCVTKLEDGQDGANARAIASLPDLIDAAKKVVANHDRVIDATKRDFPFIADRVEPDPNIEALRSALHKGGQE